MNLKSTGSDCNKAHCVSGFITLGMQWTQIFLWHKSVDCWRTQLAPNNFINSPHLLHMAALAVPPSGSRSTLQLDAILGWQYTCPIRDTLTCSRSHWTRAPGSRPRGYDRSSRVTYTAMLCEGSAQSAMVSWSGLLSGTDTPVKKTLKQWGGSTSYILRSSVMQFHIW